jgi:murein DD-endopeptidase MepM/ murein hydrolase activator NlpD
LIAVAGIVMCTVTILLCLEYRFFKQQAEKMLMLKQEYQDQLTAMNKAMQECARTKEQLMYLETLVDQQKKKSHNVVDANGSGSFPDGVKVFSHEQQKQDADAFVPINRDLSHLKQVSLNYIKEQKLHRLVHRMHPDVWQDYTQELHQKTQENSGRPARRQVGRKKRKRITNHGYSSRYTLAYDDGVKQRDINFNWPINRSQFWLSSPFGPRRHPNGSIGFHSGIDMAAVRGTLVYPAAPGVVVEARSAPGYGKTVVIMHTNKYKTRYAHLDAICVRVGQEVGCQKLIGKVGSTGHVRSRRGRGGGSHLHFEVYAYGKRLNPMYFLS